MKKLWLILFVGIFLIGVVSAAIPISDCVGLQDMNSDLGGDYYLTQDIDCNVAPYNSGVGFNPVGDTSNQFTGSFDGMGYKISNLFINRPSTNDIGLFGYAGSASSIKNIGLININLNGYLNVGGLVGTYRGSSPLTDSYSTGIVTGDQGSGGLVGYVQGPGSIVNSYSTANINSVRYYAGGLVGYARGDIIGSYATGTVSTSGSPGQGGGGLVGWSSVDIIDSYATGSVSASTTVGGLIGEAWGTGGGSIINSYAAGPVSGGTSGGVLGRIISGSLAAESDNFWDTQTTGQGSSAVGTSKTTAQMKQQATFTNWDFTNVWDIDGVTNNGYPFLRMNDFCGDGLCDTGEDYMNCGGDCAFPSCSDGIKNQDEDDVDCGGVCDDCVTYECSDSTQTIMKIFQLKNSHVAFWDDTDYIYDICYDDIFGSPYSGANPHTCDGTSSNRVLSLYQTSNSHASNVTDGDYIEEVCYGNLKCDYEVRNGDGTCTNGGEIVVRMYSGMNSHVSVEPDADYDSQICCVAGGIYWADANGDEITTQEINIGDTIQAVVTGASSGTFDITEFSGANRDIRVDVGGELDGKGNWIYKWKITQADLDLAGGSIDRFAFRIDDGNWSEEIAISGTYDDSAMDVTIVSPACGSNYSQGADVTIEISASDEDDFIESGNVSIGGVIVDTFDNGGTTFNYTFGLAGNVQIIAEAVNTRGSNGKRARHISNVMILGGDGNYVAACIDTPKDFSDLEESVVEFDASTTRAIVVSGGVPASYNPVDNPTRFSWYWRFLPEDIIREFVWSDDSFAYIFTAEFPIAGDNSANLRVEFE